MTTREIIQTRKSHDLHGLLQQCNLIASDLFNGGDIEFGVIYDDGRPIGCIGLEYHGLMGLLRSLAVAPEARGQGLGGRLVIFIEQLARQKQLNALYLLTNTAVDYFEQRGYSAILREDVPPEIQSSSQYSGLCPSTAVVMVKRLVADD